MIIKLGLDVHAQKVAICVQLDGRTPQPAQLAASEAARGYHYAHRLQIELFGNRRGT